MSNSISSLKHSQFGPFNDLLGNKVIARVKGIAAQQAYDSAVSVVLDTTIKPELVGSTVAELKAKCGPETNFALQESRAIYQTVGGSTAGTQVIPLMVVDKATVVGAIGVFSAAFTGTQAMSVGIAGDHSFILGEITANTSAIPTGGVTTLWNQTYPFATATPNAGGVAQGRLYYAQDRLLAPGTQVNLYIAVGSSAIGEGDLTVEFNCTALGQETYGITSALGRVVSSANGGPGVNFGKNFGPAVRAF